MRYDDAVVERFMKNMLVMLNGEKGESLSMRMSSESRRHHSSSQRVWGCGEKYVFLYMLNQQTS